MNNTIDTHWSNYYDQGKDFTLISQQEITRFLMYADESLPKTCLDIGCGTGQLTRELYHRGYACTGVDASASAVKTAKALTIASGNQLSYIHSDFETAVSNQLLNQKYSLVACKLVYAFVKDKQAFLQGVKELLAENGLFVIITPLQEDTPIEKRGIAIAKEDVELLRASFREVTSFNERGLWYFVGAL